MYKKLQEQKISEMPQIVREIVDNLQLLDCELSKHMSDLEITQLEAYEHEQGYCIAFKIFNTPVEIVVESDYGTYIAKDTLLAVTFFCDNHEELSYFDYWLKDGMQGFIARFKHELWPCGRMITYHSQMALVNHKLEFARLCLFAE